MFVESHDQLTRKLLHTTCQAEIQPWEEGFAVMLPYKDNFGESIEFNVSYKGESYICDDLGRISGLLFTIGQHTQDAPGHKLVKNISQAIGIEMDYDYGVLKNSPYHIEDNSGILCFIKALLALYTAIPALDFRRVERKSKRRLATRIGKDITQLRMPDYVQKQTQVKGEYFQWPIDYKYKLRQPFGEADVFVVAVDLWGKDPQGKAGHAISLATDLKSMNGHHDLRIVYDRGTTNNHTLSGEAASFIEEWGRDLKYRTFNYGTANDREQFMSLTLQELLPLNQAVH